MLANHTIKTFLRELGSQAPAPGGGSAAALVGALAGALTAMVCNLTVGHAGYEEVKEQVADILHIAEGLTVDLQKAMDQDALAFSSVMAAYQLPKDITEEAVERQVIIQNALKEACIVPLRIANLSMDVMLLARRILTIGNSHAVSDAAIAGILAYSGVHAALYNVKINIVTIKDSNFVQSMKNEIAVLQQESESVYREVVVQADQAIGFRA